MVFYLVPQLFFIVVHHLFLCHPPRRRCGNQRFRHRNIAKVPNHCGKPCDSKAAKELGSCHSNSTQLRASIIMI